MTGVSKSILELHDQIQKRAKIFIVVIKNLCRIFYRFYNEMSSDEIGELPRKIRDHLKGHILLLSIGQSIAQVMMQWNEF